MLHLYRPVIGDMLARLQGAAVGFTAYATCDLTSQSALKSWSTLLTIADLVWGTVLSATAAARVFGSREVLRERITGHGKRAA